MKYLNLIGVGGGLYHLTRLGTNTEDRIEGPWWRHLQVGVRSQPQAPHRERSVAISFYALGDWAVIDGGQEGSWMVAVGWGRWRSRRGERGTITADAARAWGGTRQGRASRRGWIGGGGGTRGGGGGTLTVDADTPFLIE
jgi:hypothetical protein